MNPETPLTDKQLTEAEAERYTEAYFDSPITKDPGDHFTAGAAFYESTILPWKMEGFVEWALTNYIRLNRNKWGGLNGKEYTSQQLIKLYFEHLKTITNEQGATI